MVNRDISDFPVAPQQIGGLVEQLKNIHLVLALENMKTVLFGWFARFQRLAVLESDTVVVVGFLRELPRKLEVWWRR